MIGGFTTQLIRKTKDDQTLSTLNIISEEVRRLEELLKELRDYYLPRTLNLEEMDILGLLQEVYDLVKEDCERKKIETDFTRPGKSVLIKGDKDKLKQVFLNLLKNAIDAMEPGGRLVIENTLSENQAEITITDNGCGIPEESREKIFSPFFTTKRHGTGLGLNISKSIIEDHDSSSLTLKSEEGKGTTFKVTLPLFSAGTGNVKRKKGKEDQ